MQKIKKILITESQINNACDGCKYFDLESIKIDYPELEKPLYFLVNKNISAKVVFISPEEYLKRISAGFGCSIEDALRHVIWKNVKKYAEAMKNGEKFKIGFYSVDGKKGQEGRHRALAAKEIGCKIIPMVEFESVHYNDVNAFVEKYHKLSREELNQLFISKGYGGITDVGWRTFDNQAYKYKK